MIAKRAHAHRLFSSLLALGAMVVSVGAACTAPAPSTSSTEGPSISPSSSQSAASAPAAPTTPTAVASAAIPPGPIQLHKDGKVFSLAHGNAHLLGDGAINVALTEDPVDCFNTPHADSSVVFTLSPGADGGFYADRSIATNIQFTYLGVGHTKVSPIKVQNGARIAGFVDYDDPGNLHHNGFVVRPSSARGNFDVPLCPLEDSPKLEPRPAIPDPDKPLTYRFGKGAGVAPRTILVMVEYDTDDREPWVSRIQVTEEKVDCDHYFSNHGVEMTMHFGLQASDLGTDQPARFGPDGRRSQVSRESNDAWVHLEPFDLAAATTVKGNVVGYAGPYDTPKGATTQVHLPLAWLTGKFEATVCRFGSKFGKPYL